MSNKPSFFRQGIRKDLTLISIAIQTGEDDPSAQAPQKILDRFAII